MCENTGCFRNYFCSLPTTYFKTWLASITLRHPVSWTYIWNGKYRKPCGQEKDIFKVTFSPFQTSLCLGKKYGEKNELFNSNFHDIIGIILSKAIFLWRGIFFVGSRVVVLTNSACQDCDGCVFISKLCVTEVAFYLFVFINICWLSHTHLIPF